MDAHFDDRVAMMARDIVQRHLDAVLKESADAPIPHPDENGVFPGTWLGTFLHGESSLVVPDSCVLRNDIAHAVRKGRRTLLVTGASRGAFRLFCASHVPEEFRRDSERWARDLKISHDAYVACWEEQYLPHLRVIDDGDVPTGVLAPSEERRVRLMGASKDVPSIRLALALGAFYLTDDGPAWRAVYGSEANEAERRRWLQVLNDGGDADELAKLLMSALVVPAITIGSVVELGRWIARKAPWAFVPLTAGALFLALRTSRETYRSIGAGLFDASLFLHELYQPYLKALDRFRCAAPTIPAWDELAATNDRRAILTRACLHTLARAPQSHMTAVELAKVLPDLGVGQNANLVRVVVRQYHCFTQVGRGRWQVGHTAQTRVAHLVVS